MAAAGIAAAAAMIGAAVTVAYNLDGGFARAADEADMPDVIVHFDQRDAGLIASRVHALPNLAAASLQLEQRPELLSAPGRPQVTSGDVLATLGARHPYKIVSGRDLPGGLGEVVIERGLAAQLHLAVGDRIDVGPPSRAIQARVVGIAVAPDNVAFPYASGARVWMPYPDVQALAGGSGRPVNTALLWVRDRSQLEVTLEQARAAVFGLTGLNFVTRQGVGVLVDGAAGIVIALLVAVSLGALLGAFVMIAATARAEVQRRLEAIALVRALGASTRSIVAAAIVEAWLIAVPAAVLGLAAGAVAANSAVVAVLHALDQFPRGAAVLAPLAGCFAALLALVAAAAAWPTWRACRAPVAPALRDAELPATPRGAPVPAGTFGLGMRMALARPVRTVATVVVMAGSIAVALLLVGLAAELQRLENDPSAISKHYQLTTHSSTLALQQIRHLPGVAAAGQRFSSSVADSFQLGESFELVAYCGDRLRFEDPPLAAGNRATLPQQAEVGQGLSDPLGLVPGSTLAVQFGDGDEARFHVTGIVRTLDNDGRVVYVQPGRDICSFRGGQTVIQLKSGADPNRVEQELRLAGHRAAAAAGVTTRNAGFLGVIADLLRTVAVIDGLVCVYVLAQMLGLVALERRGTVGLMRAVGAAPAQIATMFLGAATVVVGLAFPLAVVVERLLLGPRTAALAASYATVPLGAGTLELVVSLGAVIVIAVAASVIVARRMLLLPVTRLLRDP
jgi:predicted lysophospholipase L1 biosynthesis ABC-type transport system permease subunit